MSEHAVVAMRVALMEHIGCDLQSNVPDQGSFGEPNCAIFVVLMSWVLAAWQWLGGQWAVAPEPL
ncbi:MAG: hypothetical protein WCJ66_02925 [Verrucomicrobiota bacterium]